MRNANDPNDFAPGRHLAEGAWSDWNTGGGPGPGPSAAARVRRRRVLLWVFLGVVLCIALFGVVLVLVLRHTFTNAAPYQMALELLRSDPQVMEVLGEPVRESWWVTGSMRSSGSVSSASLRFTISGPRGAAQVDLRASNLSGQWVIHLLRVFPDGGPPFDVVAPSEGPIFIH